MSEILKAIGENPWTVISSDVFAVISAVVIMWLAYRLGQPNNDYPINWLLCLLGALLGWVVGMLAAPYKGEEARFLAVGQAISAFISGYLVSKLDRFLEASLYTTGTPVRGAWIRLCLFGASFLLAVIVVFINRLYFNVH